jgi:hypothetical protein
MKTITFTLVLLLSVTMVFSQTKSKKQLRKEVKAQKIQLIKDGIYNKTFVFKAYSVVPMNEKTKALTTDFGIEVRGDSIFSYMPYYGNTYSRERQDASFNNSPMGFMQPMESYKRTKTKKGYEVEVEVNNNGDIINLVFHISQIGSASVVASSLNRQAISYMGDIFVPIPKLEEENN